MGNYFSQTLVKEVGCSPSQVRTNTLPNQKARQCTVPEGGTFLTSAVQQLDDSRSSSLTCMGKAPLSFPIVTHDKSILSLYLYSTLPEPVTKSFHLSQRKCSEPPRDKRMQNQRALRKLSVDYLQKSEL